MPLYEYECQTEGNRFEVIQKFSDAPLSVCPTCGGAVKRLISSPAIQFKGSGWYITDYARKGNSGTDGSSATKSNGSKDQKDGASGSSSASSSNGSSTSSSTSDSASSKSSSSTSTSTSSAT